MDMPVRAATRASFEITVNGEARRVEVDLRTTLLDLLREHLGLTGTKKGCDHGQCGACTVLVGNRRINACLSLAIMHEGESVTTIEGVGLPGALHPMQVAFLDRDAFQCGYCTPGQICSSLGMLAEVARGEPSEVTGDLAAETIPLTDEEIRERMSGNICRCSAYPQIREAIRDVAGAPA
ncbi:MAG TPA: 2Fe-2S iron-sulfur cluster-binding protein [Caulobacteraceae bacterium]|nr:2Fe-2S iron-sulfur cluster-binding protein [Caulobacteraceae bacterium]